MNYYIAFVNEDGYDWCSVATNDYDKIVEIYELLCPPPGWEMELRVTEEDIDTHVHYEVLRSTHNFM